MGRAWKAATVDTWPASEGRSARSRFNRMSGPPPRSSGNAGARRWVVRPEAAELLQAMSGGVTPTTMASHRRWVAAIDYSAERSERTRSA